MVIYDNINRRHQVWQAKLGQVWEQLNGTAPFVVLLSGGDAKHFDATPVEQARRENRRLALTTDALRDSIDFTHQRSIMANHVLLFLFSWVPSLSRHKERVYDTFRTTLAKRRIPPGRKTEIFPLGTSALNEATTAGTQDVINDIFIDQLGMKPEDVSAQLRLVGGDQLTVARIRGLQNYLASCPHGYAALKWIIPLVLVWHMGWADLARVISTHYGRNAAGDPSTFKHVNVLLKRRVKDEDRPDFYPALKLVSETLKADTLNCWM
ncbi:hypothetical protein EXIGLDRAFT_621471 [Exidia glandulosa HHB12029]|uniref:DUF6589 domain-containing protein n=1 Tax=Exidia glandulosa HHB12029 TaxID=1314781 RepID=A0A165EEJ5_EXIGL|nr:hypothetical protein EXIGLDRAFT_621471 [Exidia glandulosa HHB12029]